MRRSTLIVALLLVAALQASAAVSVSAAPAPPSSTRSVPDLTTEATRSAPAPARVQRFAERWRSKANRSAWRWVRQHSTSRDVVDSAKYYRRLYGRFGRLEPCTREGDGWNCEARNWTYFLDIEKRPAGLRVSNVLVMD